MSELVLDAWAIMAWLNRELPAGIRVRDWLRASRAEVALSMSVINLGEVYYKAWRNQGQLPADDVLLSLRSRVKVVAAHEPLVLHAAALKAENRISYADGFAAATALALHAPLATGDPELRTLARRLPALQLEWLGPSR